MGVVICGVDDQDRYQLFLASGRPKNTNVFVYEIGQIRKGFGVVAMDPTVTEFDPTTGDFTWVDDNLVNIPTTATEAWGQFYQGNAGGSGSLPWKNSGFRDKTSLVGFNGTNLWGKWLGTPLTIDSDQTIQTYKSEQGGTNGVRCWIDAYYDPKNDAFGEPPHTVDVKGANADVKGTNIDIGA
jgi:hypothetical protein